VVISNPSAAWRMKSHAPAAGGTKLRRSSCAPVRSLRTYRHCDEVDSILIIPRRKSARFRVRTSATANASAGETVAPTLLVECRPDEFLIATSPQNTILYLDPPERPSIVPGADLLDQSKAGPTRDGSSLVLKHGFCVKIRQHFVLVHQPLRQSARPGCQIT